MNFGLMQFFPTDKTGKTAKKAKTFKAGKSNHGYWIVIVSYVKYSNLQDTHYAKYFIKVRLRKNAMYIIRYVYIYLHIDKQMYQN